VRSAGLGAEALGLLTLGSGALVSHDGDGDADDDHGDDDDEDDPTNSAHRSTEPEFGRQ
jgi:hypothetical protein